MKVRGHLDLLHKARRHRRHLPARACMPNFVVLVLGGPGATRPLDRQRGGRWPAKLRNGAAASQAYDHPQSCATNAAGEASERGEQARGSRNAKKEPAYVWTLRKKVQGRTLATWGSTAVVTQHLQSVTGMKKTGFLAFFGHCNLKRAAKSRCLHILHIS